MPSVAPSAVPVFAPSVVVVPVRRRVRYRSSSGHRLPLLASPAPLVSVCGSLRGRVGGVLASLLCVCRAACRIVFPMGLAAACGGGVLVLVMLFVLACLAMGCRIAILPALFDKTDGAMLRTIRRRDRSCDVA